MDQSMTVKCHEAGFNYGRNGLQVEPEQTGGWKCEATT